MQPPSLPAPQVLHPYLNLQSSTLTREPAKDGSRPNTAHSLASPVRRGPTSTPHTPSVPPTPRTPRPPDTRLELVSPTNPAAQGRVLGDLSVDLGGRGGVASLAGSWVKEGSPRHGRTSQGGRAVSPAAAAREKAGEGRVGEMLARRRREVAHYGLEAQVTISNDK